MGQKDIISKTLIEQLAACLVTQLLKLSVVPDTIEWLSPEYQRVEDRRADMVVRMQASATDKPCLLHLEIQNTNDADMPLRMLRYYTDIRFRWKNEPLKQYVIYTGKAKLSMASGIDEIAYGYEIIDMRTIDCALLLSEDTPDALVLAILCDFKARNAEDIVSYILKRLHQLTGDDSHAFRRYVHMLELLSENRDLQHIVKETEQMLTEFNVEQLPSFQIAMQRGEQRGLQRGEKLGLQRGEQLGLQRGEQLGLQRGIQQAQAEERHNRMKFATQLIGELPDQRIADMFELSLSEVSALRDRA